MPHRIKLLSNAQYQDPLVDYGSTEFVLQFQDAASLLQQWRNPHLGRSSREGIVLSIAASTRMAESHTQQLLLTTELSATREQELVDQLKVYRFMLERTLPEVLELVNQDKLLTPEDILKFIQQHLKLMDQAYGYRLTYAEEMMNQLNDITDLEVRDQFGRKRRVQRSDVLDVLGRVLGSLLIRQATLRPVDNIEARPRGRVKFKETYRAAIVRSTTIPPADLKSEDIRVIDKDRLSLVYFIVDVSQSMSKTAFKSGLTRLDGALLTSLGLYYFFNLTNRRKRREFDSFQMHLVPVVEIPYVIEEKNRLEDFLFNAKAKGKTRLVHAVNTVVKHVAEQHKDNDFDVHLIVLTDGRPNVPFIGRLPGKQDSALKHYFSDGNSKTKPDTQECMIQLNQYFTSLRKSKNRSWNISYFLMAPEKFRNTDLFADTREMLTGITRPILIDPTEVDSLGYKILMEAMRG